MLRWVAGMANRCLRRTRSDGLSSGPLPSPALHPVGGGSVSLREDGTRVRSLMEVRIPEINVQDWTRRIAAGVSFLNLPPSPCHACRDTQWPGSLPATTERACSLSSSRPSPDAGVPASVSIPGEVVAARGTRRVQRTEPPDADFASPRPQSKYTHAFSQG